MEKKKEVSSTGQVTRVDVKFAYLTSDRYGCVFVPPSAALPKNCPDADLTLYYKAGDVVHFTAVPQKGKNDCQWLATKVAPSSNNDIYQAPCYQISSLKQVVAVTMVTETYAYAANDELGTVFIPGSAFSQAEVAKLDSHMTVGDSVLVRVRSQAPRCGCNWIAEFATKLTDLNFPPSAVMNSVDGESAADVNIKRGTAVITWVNKFMACAVSLNEVKVMCPILTWSGGDNGKLYADNLTDVIKAGERIYFEASPWNEAGLRAKWWSTEAPKKKYSNSYTQTALTVEQMIIRSLEPDILQHLQLKIPNIIELAKQL